MKIICIGRNYIDHAKELNNPVPTKPLVFIKPPSALLVNNKPLYYPLFTEDLHYEVEVVLKICKNGKYVRPEFASGYYCEVALGIDFTARDLQAQCKTKGHPWEIAKGFDGSALVSPFVPIEKFDKNAIEFRLDKNGQTVQSGNTKDMIFSFEKIISYTSQFFKMQMGDYIFTGTPAGVGTVQIGDLLEGYLFLKDQDKAKASPIFHCEIK
ncbi:MAG TPA: FAA hydrolase family protein [Phaeodactylibacter sp.]|nr:FAA hydrolase family protein [Phaeodactylibacter sp.]